MGVKVVEPRIEVEDTERTSGRLVTVRGDIDVCTAPHLKRVLIEAIDGGCKSIIVDLSHVEYLDSTGLGMLIGCLKRCKEQESCLAIRCEDNWQVWRKFTITGLDTIFDRVIGGTAE